MKISSNANLPRLRADHLKKAAWAAPDVVTKATFGVLAYGPGGVAAASIGSLPASAINLRQAFDEQRKGIGSWKLVAANALNVAAGVGAAGVSVAGLVDPSYQTAALVGLGMSAGANVLTGVLNYAKDMGKSHKMEATEDSAVAARALGQQVRRNWKSGLVEGAKHAALGAAAGAAGVPLVVAVANVGLNIVSEMGSLAIAVMTAGFSKAGGAHLAMPNLLELASNGAGIGAAVGLAAGVTFGLLPQIKRGILEACERKT